MTPIYESKGAAKEYGDLALNIYTGCPHRCWYCFAPNVLRRDREEFHRHVEPRPGIAKERDAIRQKQYLDSISPDGARKTVENLLRKRRR